METTVNTLAYSKRLRTRLRELEAEKVSETKAHKEAVTKWRKDLLAWVKANAAERAAELSIERPSRFGGDDRLNFRPEQFFRGAPKAPVAPTDEKIRKVRALLRQLAITGQKTIRVTTKDVAELFGEGEIEDE